MKKWTIFLAFSVLTAAFILALAIPGGQAEALPEYSAQTGEPCATCHLSPSGGGSRTPRGQAWVGSGKPGAVPELVAALEQLGVHMQVNQEDYTLVPDVIQPSQPLLIAPADTARLFEWVSGYGGN
jgi:mono/diheme cytochrome c family protein